MEPGFASIDAYLARLPNGLDSYPHMHCKASVLRGVLADLPVPLSGLPPRLADLVLRPPSPSDWVREVEHWSILLAVHDRLAARDGAQAYEAWSYKRNVTLLGGPLYRVLFAVLSPERLVVGAAQRYGAFHRGTVMSRIEGAAGRTAFRLTTPPHVLPDVAHVTLSMAFKAALDLAGARDVAVDVQPESPESVSFFATWR